jgi:hypothetical protein
VKLTHGPTGVGVGVGVTQVGQFEDTRVIWIVPRPPFEVGVVDEQIYFVVLLTITGLCDVEQHGVYPTILYDDEVIL